jgi:molybdopterin-guanine dinucleotide biosynthesis adapter protein
MKRNDRRLCRSFRFNHNWKLVRVQNPFSGRFSVKALYGKITLFQPWRSSIEKAQLPPVLSIVGRSRSGKTTLIEKLIPLLKQRGFRVGTVKHHAHPGFDIDYPGKDSWRHEQAGSDHIIIAAPDMVAEIVKLQHPRSPTQIISSMHDVDIILTDGYRSAGFPKIEVMRKALSTEPVCDPKDLLAIASDFEIDLGIPHVDLNNPVAILELLIGQFLPGASGAERPSSGPIKA